MIDHKKTPVDEVVDAIAVAAELTQTSMTPIAMAVLARDLLQSYPVPSILRALDRCRRELGRSMRQSDVEQFIHAEDGRPGPDEAWGIALQMFDEAATVVTNEEIAEALEGARAVMDSGDNIGARRTFIETYSRITRHARDNHFQKPNWFASLGDDKLGREYPIQQALDRGLLSQKQAAIYLPKQEKNADTRCGDAIAGLLAGKVVEFPSEPRIRANLSKLAEVLKAGKA